MSEYKVNIYLADDVSDNRCFFDWSIMEQGAYKVYVTYSGGQADLTVAQNLCALLNTNLFDGCIINNTYITDIGDQEQLDTTYKFAIPLQHPSPILTDSNYGSLIYRETIPIHIGSRPTQNNFIVIINSVWLKQRTDKLVETIKGLLSLRFVKI